MAKKYTLSQWTRMQSSLPPEDRVPYSQSPEKTPATPTTPTAQPKTDAQKSAQEAISMGDTVFADEKSRLRAQRDAAALASTPPLASDPYYTRDPKTGLSPAQVDAQKALQEAQAARKELGLGGFISTTPGSAGKIETPPATGLKPGYEWYKLSLPGGGFEWRQRPTSGAFTGGTGFTGGAGFTGSTGVPTSSGPTLARDVFKATMALYFGEAEAAKGWMDELYNVVSKYYRSGSDIQESFNMALLDARKNPNLAAFTNRFKGIYALQDLRQAGKPVKVPTIAEYVASQAGMADLLNQANLGDLANEEFTGELIGMGNSVTTVAEKIAKAYQRIDMAPKAIKDTLGRFFPTVDRTKLARTILLGKKGVDELVDELGKLEVLAAAEQQGLGAITKAGGLTEERAQEYARMGGTFQSLLPKFGQIARALPTTSKLAGISRTEDIGQVGLEKAVITQSAKELQQLEQLTAEEEARFAAKQGRAELGMASQRRANRAF